MKDHRYQWIIGVLFVVTGILCLWYYVDTKEMIDLEREQNVALVKEAPVEDGEYQSLYRTTWTINEEEFIATMYIGMHAKDKNAISLDYIDTIELTPLNNDIRIVGFPSIIYEEHQEKDSLNGSIVFTYTDATKDGPQNGVKEFHISLPKL